VYLLGQVQLHLILQEMNGKKQIEYLIYWLIKRVLLILWLEA
jgi:hypothetical protein